jgi:hypothetical protein
MDDGDCVVSITPTPCDICAACMHDWMRMMEGTLGIYDVRAGCVATWGWQASPLSLGTGRYITTGWMMGARQGGMTMEMVDMCCHLCRVTVKLTATVAATKLRHDMGGQICYYGTCRFSVFFALFFLYLPPAACAYNGGMASRYWMGISRYVDVWKTLLVWCWYIARSKHKWTWSFGLEMFIDRY